MRTMKHAISLLSSLLLFSCGGSGSSQPTPPTPPAAPVISYAPASHTFTTEVAIATFSPTVSGGAPTQYSVSPELPAGLSLSVTSGQISGTPTQPLAAANYVVTASNAGGSSNFSLSISVNSGTLLELVHVNDIIAVRYDGGRILSRDRRGIWALWNATTRERLAGGALNCPLDCDKSIALAGFAAVIQSDTGIEVRSATDGASLWSVSFPSGFFWSLATDGSYVAFGDNTALTVRSLAGTQLFNVAGDFGPSRPFATPSELRLAQGPSGPSVIRRYSIPSGNAMSTLSFQGVFHSWFADGSHFMANLDNALWVYSSDGALQGAGTFDALIGLAGSGNRIWRRVPHDPPATSDLKFYSFGPAFAEVASFALPPLANDLVPSGNTLGVIVANETAHGIIDLSTPTPTWANYSTPVSHVSAYAATSPNDVAFGNHDGVLMRHRGGTAPEHYTLGRVRSLVGSTTRFALSFSSGNINYYDAATGTLQGVIETPPPLEAAFHRTVSARLQLSRDGNTLAVGAVSQDGANAYVTLYSLPSEGVVGDFYFGPPEELANYSLSGSGDVLSFKSTSSSGANTSIARVARADGSIVWSQAQYAGDLPLLTHSGNGAAFAQTPVNVSSISQVVENGALAGTLDGVFINWLDEQRAIVNRFTTGPSGFMQYDGARIVNRQNQVLASPALPQVVGFDVAGTDRIYVPQLNQILDATNGNTLWDSASSDPLPPPGGLGAIAGDYVVFGTYTRIRIEPHE